MHPGLPAPRIAPTLGLLNGFPRRRESREELVVMPQAGAVRAASLKPSWCCSPSTCFHCLPSPTNRLCPSPPFSATPTQSGCHRPPAVTRTVPGPSPAALAPHRRTRSPSAEPTHPGEGAGLGWTVVGAAAGLRSWGPRRQRRARVGSTRTIRSPGRGRADRGAPRGGQRRLCEAGTLRGALSGAAAAGGGARWAAGGVRPAPQPAPRCSAPRPRQPARRWRKRGARTLPRDQGCSRAHAPLAPPGKAG